MKKIVIKIYQKIFVRRSFYKLNYLFYQLLLRGLGIFNFEDRHVSGENLALSIAATTKINTIIDIGAHKGGSTQALNLHFLQSKVYAVEPHPANVKYLTKKFANNSNITVMPYAISQKSGSLILYDYQNTTGSQHASFHKQVFTDLGKKATKHKVNALSLDQLLKKIKLDSVDYLRVDVEGEEINIFKGASKTLSQGKIKFIEFEFNYHNVYSHTTLQDFKRLLSKYKLYRLTPDALIDLNKPNYLLQEIYGYQNILAISASVPIANYQPHVIHVD